VIELLGTSEARHSFQITLVVAVWAVAVNTYRSSDRTEVVSSAVPVEQSRPLV